MELQSFAPVLSTTFILGALVLGQNGFKRDELAIYR